MSAFNSDGQEISDHDLLIRIDERVEQIFSHLEADDKKIASLENEMHEQGLKCDEDCIKKFADKKDFEKIELAVEWLKKNVWMATGVISAAVIIAGILVRLH